MAQPTTQLNATEQDTLVKQIGLALLRAAPRDWRRVTAEYRAVGRYHEMTGEIVTEDGAVHEWVATHDIATLFGKLRAGMYRDGRGTWFNARYQLDHPSSYNLEYNRDEPQWHLAPPPQAYSDELRMFPRSEENVPEWLIRRMSGLPTEGSGPRFRIARIFDTVGPAGRPVINRPDVEVEEQDRLLEYLDSAPLVVSERGYDIDRLAQNPEPTVPVAFHSDGQWIWPAAVNFYLRQYGVSPESDLIEHIRGAGFALPEVDEPTLQAAAAYLQPPRPANPGQVPPQQQAVPQVPPQAPPAPPVQQPPMPAMPPMPPAPPVALEQPAAPAPAEPADPPFEEEFDQTQFHRPVFEDEYEDEHGLEQTEQFDEAPAADLQEPAPAGLVANGSEPAVQHETTYLRAPRFDEAPEFEEPELLTHNAPPPEPPPVPVVPVVQEPIAPVVASPEPEPREPALAHLRSKLAELNVPAGVYGIDEPAEHGWSVEQVEAGWRVGWYDGGLTNPAVFGDPEDAAAFMLGKLLLDPDGQAFALPEEAAEEPEPVEEIPPPSPVFATLSPGIATGNFSTVEPRDGFAVDNRPEQGELGGQPAAAASPMPPMPPMPQAPPPLAPPRREPPPPAPTVAVPLPPQPIPPPPRREEPVRPPAPVGAGQQANPNQQWPIGPMAGEPPLTLFRGKELRELPAGSELDRFGGPNGNLTYAAGTPFHERSLVPDWVNRPYHVYRVQRPLDALAGVAIPWFNQPGGGSAYLLPASIEELLAEGDLIELDPGEPPID